MNVSIKWKSNKKPPEKVLQSFFDMAKIEENESVVFYSNTFELIPKHYIKDCLEFSPDKLDEYDKDELIIKTIIHCFLEKCLKPSDFINQINQEVRKIYRKYEEKHVLTSISILKLPFKEIKIFESTVKFYKRIPQKFVSRIETLKQLGSDGSEGKNYYKCLISTKTHSNELTVHLNNLNIFRALISFNNNYSSQYFMGGGIRKTPINRVCLGLYHTLHKSDGKILGHSVGYELKFIELPTIEIKQSKRSFSKILSKIESSPYSEKLKTSLLLYVKALDDYDADIALVLLWNALDTLTNEDTGNYDNVIDRTKIVLGNNFHHHEAITAIKNVRNNYVHKMIHNKNARTYCYELQNYFKHIFFFHLYHLSHLNSMTDALTTIDYIGKLSNNYIHHNNMIKTAKLLHKKIKSDEESIRPTNYFKGGIKHSKKQ
ncbi:TPA: hypothetical protein ACY4VY_001604 [Legionella pneumophila]